MTELDRDIAAFDQMTPVLQTRYCGRWVIIRDRGLAGTFDTFDEAAEDAVRRFGRGPYLIRQVGAPRAVMPVSLVHVHVHGV
ncbi:MAG TPA: hypothetical protein VEY95_15600 [Azospirillaceae bacterium]|nr:hypothetical protein [Azospirillaceae bacterium]